jgi:hypothetical protein
MGPRYPMHMNPDDKEDGIAEETKRIMERLIKTPPAPHDSDKAKRSQAQKKKARPAKASPSFSKP